ncbi:MAG: 30S ribosome-binding factor RbfA [Dehalococcoidia bacterium]|nr:MAG: 30S ribosome-binding factor RbfA [Dehalococcoidia bacterium]
MPNRRQRRVAELIHEELSELLQRQTRDPRLGFVTITGVDVTPDLREARVYFTILGDEAEVKETLAGLTSASGYFRRQLGHTLSLRYAPELTFKLDTSLEYGLHIDHLLDSIKNEYEPPAEEE